MTLTPHQEERHQLVKEAGDAIAVTIRQFPFGVSLMAIAMTMAAMFRTMDDSNPPPEVKEAWGELQAQLELFVGAGYIPFLRAGERPQ